MWPKLRFCRLQLVLILVLFSLPSRSVTAQTVDSKSSESDLSLASISIGLDGTTRPGVWTRLKADVRGRSSGPVRLEIVAPDPFGHPVTYSAAEVNVDGERGIQALFAVGRLECSVTVRLVTAADGMELVRRRLTCGADSTSDIRMLRHSTGQWLFVGPAPAAVSSSSSAAMAGSGGTGASQDDTSAHRTILETTAGFPEDWRSLSSFSAVFLCGDFQLNAAQSLALRRWVQQGGRLTVAVGTRHEALQQSTIGEWILKDVTLRSMTLSDLSGLEAFASSGTRVPVASRVRGVVFDIQDGETLVPGIDGNLLVRFAYGFGQVSLLGLDLDRAPLSRWRSLDQFLTALSGQRSRERTASRTSQRISRSGITDLATQLHLGLEKLPEVEGRSTLNVLGLAVLYLLLIGPLDYILVHRFLKQPRLTWFTFPCGVLLASGLASLLAGSGNPDGVVTRRLELLDLDVATKTVRHNVWGTVYSPRSRRYPVEIRHRLTGLLDESGGNAATTHENQMTGRLLWFASPETGFGSLYRPGGVEMDRPGYRFGTSGQIENLPIRVRSDRVTHSMVVSDAAASLFESDLKRMGTGQLDLASGFTHRLPGAVSDWLVVHGTRVYLPKLSGTSVLTELSLKPGQRWQPDSDFVAGRELRGFLTGSTFQRIERPQSRGGGGDFSVTQVPWDSRNDDLTAIIRMLTLHDLAGGADYTGLQNALLRTLEMTDSLPLDRALLLGRLSEPSAEVLVNGSPAGTSHQDVFLRVLMPVAEAPVEKSLPKFDTSR